LDPRLTAKLDSCGDNLVIIGFGSKHLSPKLESVYIELDDKPKPVIPTQFSFKLNYGALPIKELDDAIILKKGNEFLAKVFFSDYSPGSVSEVIDFPYPIGVAFVKEPVLRTQDPYELIGTSAARDVYLLVKPA